MSATQWEAGLKSLAECRRPMLIGVRHHSAALSRAMPALLEEFSPECLLVELPHEFAPWLEWLGHDELRAPVALAASGAGIGLSFYPFADFSPELVAIRWCLRRGVPIVPCDLPLSDRRGLSCVDHLEHTPRERAGLLARLLRRTESANVGELWERLVESPAAGSSPEALRRAALLFGWALRVDDGEASLSDRRREARMRECLASAPERSVAVVGSYHAAALLPEPLLWSAPPDAGADGAAAEIATALIPYSFEQLDERSGYPAGVRDPQWHQQVVESVDATALDLGACDLAVAVCRRLRAAGHPAGGADALEVVRMMRDLARLRTLAAPGRRELIEALQTCLTRGELLGVGRAVARAAEQVLIGERRGRLPAGAPKSGLQPHVVELIRELNLPDASAAAKEPKRLRLDPLRSRLDRARVVLFARFEACGIPYATLAPSPPDALRETLTSVWDVQWTHATEATIELSAARGATLEQAARGVLRPVEVALAEEGRWAVAHLEWLERVAACGFPDLVVAGLRALPASEFLAQAGLTELSRALDVLHRLRSGHIPGMAARVEDVWPPHTAHFTFPEEVSSLPLLQTALSRVNGLFGSENPADVVALLELVLWFQQQDELPNPDVPTANPAPPIPSPVYSLEAGRLLWQLRRMRLDGASLMQGAATAALLLLGDESSAEFGATLAGWYDAAVDDAARRALQKRLNGAALAGYPRLVADPSTLDALESRLDQLDDATFLQRLPALRGGFQILSPASRERLLQTLLARLPASAATPHAASPAAVMQARDSDPEEEARRFAADEAGRRAVAALLPLWDWSVVELGTAESSSRHTVATAPARQLELADRWRLALGSRSDPCQSPLASRAARALDELYGNGRGEGSGRGLPSSGGGREAPYPTVREWSGDLELLFGEEVRQEVLSKALAAGRTAAIDELSTEQVQPSVELLQQLLSLQGALPPDRSAKLRQLVRRVIDELQRALATRLRPTLSGLSVARPTRRRTRRIDLPRTIRSNLHTARIDEDGATRLTPERFVFRTVARRNLDWHLVLIVDVSGSMEASVIYSAMMSAIFAGLPALTVQFLAFSTEVLDLSGHVGDPLDLLLEVQVGGGTRIGLGLKAARERMKTPRRTLLLLVTDFEEGWSVPELLGEVRACAETGATLLGLAALDDGGQPRFHEGIAGEVVAAGMPVAALSPTQLARWVAERIR